MMMMMIQKMRRLTDLYAVDMVVQRRDGPRRLRCDDELLLLCAAGRRMTGC